MIHHIKKLAALPEKVDMGLFLIRVGLAIVFIIHGWQKLSGISGTIVFFNHLGFATFWAYVVPWTEIVGGLLVLLGIFTNWAAIILAMIMFVVIVMVKGSTGIGSYQLELLLFLSAVAIALSGPGTYTAKSLIGRK